MLLDWMMPGQDGLAVLRAMRENSVTRPIPIIMMTARADEVDRVLGLELGADDYVTKPFSCLLYTSYRNVRNFAQRGTAGGIGILSVLRRKGNVHFRAFMRKRKIFCAVLKKRIL